MHLGALIDQKDWFKVHFTYVLNKQICIHKEHYILNGTTVDLFFAKRQLFRRRWICWPSPRTCRSLRLSSVHSTRTGTNAQRTNSQRNPFKCEGEEKVGKTFEKNSLRAITIDKRQPRLIGD